MPFVTIKLPKAAALELAKIRDHYQAARGTKPSQTDAIISLIHHAYLRLQSGEWTQEELVRGEAVPS